MSRPRAPYVAVVGAGDASPSQVERAEEVGQRLAEAGAVIVCGGLGGVMHAAARGCERAGGISVGVLPGDDRDPASPHLGVAIATGMGEARNAVIARTVDSVIAVGGGYGTLSEIALAAKMGKLVVGLDTWALPGADGAVVHADSAEDAVRLALDAARSRRS
jgi:uncharacterized protein (TIGR00725 family)